MSVSAYDTARREMHYYDVPQDLPTLDLSPEIHYQHSYRGTILKNSNQFF